MKRLAIARYSLWLLYAACVLADASSRHFGLSLAFAQDQPTSPTQVVINQIDASAFPNIKLFVSVQDAAGKMIRGLESKDFFVTEDEVEQSPVTAATQLPSVATVLVLDTSGSMKGAIADTKQAATAYVELARSEDEMCLMVFSDRPETVQNFTADKNALKRAVDGIKARGNTALYDAAYEAIKSFGEKKGRKVIILLTDGKDDDGTNKPLSKKTLDDVIKVAKETNIPIFAIGLGKDIDEGVLKKLASESGGRYFASPSSADLAALYQEISAQLTGQYLLSYATDLSERDGSWHRVVVKVAGSTGQKQYMAPLDQASASPPAPPPATETKPAAPPPSSAAAAKPSINVLAASQGTQILFITSQYNDSDWAAARLIDEAIGEAHGYSSKDASPQEILFELPKTAILSSAVIDPYTTEREDRWAKDVEIWVSTVGPYDGFTKAASVTVDNKRMESQDPSISLTEQTFPIPETRARWVKVLLKNNYGGDYVQLGEIKLLGSYSEEKEADPLAGLVNVFSQEIGGKILYFSSQYNDSDWAAKNLIDGKVGKGQGYCSADNKPVEILFVLPQVLTISHVAFNPFTTENPNRWAQEVEVQVSTEGPKQGFQSAGVFTLHNRLGADPNKPLPDQIFALKTPVQARFIKLFMHKNHGGSYMQLGEFKAFTPKP